MDLLAQTSNLAVIPRESSKQVVHTLSFLVDMDSVHKFECVDAFSFLVTDFKQIRFVFV